MTNLAGNGILGRLLERTIDDGSDRQRWLEARQGRITATMAKELVRGGAGARRRVIEESLVPPVQIVGNRYLDRGTAREPEIAEWVRARFGIEPNARLFAAAENERHASTPDGIGERLVELDLTVDLVLAEIKTSKHDLDPRLSYFRGTGYLEQMQWQMYTTGAQRTLFVWEQHDDDWEHGPNPIDLEPHFAWIDRDDALIERMIAAADLALAERDRILAERATGVTGEEMLDQEILGLAIAVLSAREEAKVAEARLKTPWNRMLALLAKRPEFSKSSGLAQVTWTNRVDVAVVPDQDAALAAEVVGLPGYTGADLLADVQDNERALAESDLAKALAASRKVWESHLAEHTKRTERSVQKLTVTAPKPAKETNR